jgi:hypothetical protein
MKPTLLYTSLLTVSLICACAGSPEKTAAYTPGLGEIMTQISTRHAKLWFAGQAKNWQLAGYELDELLEGFADANTYHPQHKDIKAIPDLIKAYMDAPLQQLEQAIKQQNPVLFASSYDALTDGCNACHQTTQFGFNKVIRPMSNPFANQAFSAN